MEVMLNLVDTLMEIGVHKNWQSNTPDDPQPGTVDPMSDFNKEKENKVAIELKIIGGLKRKIYN